MKPELNHPTAEATTLAAMRDDAELAVQLAEVLDMADYSTPQYQAIFEAIKRLATSMEPLDAHSIADESLRVAKEQKLKVTVTPEFVAALSGDSRRAAAYAATVKRRSWLRKAGDVATWILSELETHPDPDELFVAAQERWQALMPRRDRGATLYGWETIEHTHETLLQREVDALDGNLRRFDWPATWATWNKWIRPLRAGLVGVLAAPDGVGKSTYLEWIAEHWAQRGNKTVLVHLEDDHDYKLDRRLARWSTVPLDAIEDGTLTATQRDMIAGAETKIAPWAANLHYTHAPGWSMSEVIKELKKLVDEGECQAVVLDYIDKCEPDRRQLQLYGSNQYLREGDNMNMLKNFAEQAKVPIFTATQGNKSMQDQGKVQTRQAIDGSGKKSQRAQLVIILTRPIAMAGGIWDGPNKLADEGDYSPIATLRIDKQNRGATKSFFQVFRGECYRIGDLPEGFDVSQLQGQF